jgi:transcription initiation factor TFIIE subunit beta
MGMKKLDMSLQSLKDSFKKRMLAQPSIVKQTIKVEDERQLPTKMYYQPIEIPLSRKLFEIIDCLKQEPVPITNNDIIRKTTIDIISSPELFDAVKNNDRILYNPTTETFEYKPNYKIRTKEDLLDLLRRHRGVLGMEVKELKQSYTRVTELIDELDKEKRILCMRNKDGTPKVVYYNDPSFQISISDEFKVYWNDVKLPMDMDLEPELRKAGLQPMQVQFKKIKSGNDSKGKKKRKSRFKMTNTHLEGVDLKASIK